MSLTTLDTETTITNDGHAFTASNRLCYVGLGSDIYEDYDVEYTDTPYGNNLGRVRKRIEDSTVLVGQNIKFDLHWIRRYINDIKFPRVYDTQLAEFLLSNQQRTYASLADMASRYGLGAKLDVVATEYWANGIDTPDVPEPILREYLETDVRLTRGVHDCQMELFKSRPATYKLFQLQCEDLLILADMEFNGLRYDFAKAAELSKVTAGRVLGLDRQLVQMFGEYNYNSSDVLSCILYGGSLPVRCRVKYIRELKDGPVEKEKWGTTYQDFPQMVKPIRGTEGEATKLLDGWQFNELNMLRKSEGKSRIIRHYSTAEPVLRRLKVTGKAKKFIDLILERAELEKLDSTYYSGLIAKRDVLGWQNDEVHGQFNQVVARTGRLSSSGPNLQNFSGDIKELFYSRYND